MTQGQGDRPRRLASGISHNKTSSSAMTRSVITYQPAGLCSW